MKYILAFLFGVYVAAAADSSKNDGGTVSWGNPSLTLDANRTAEVDVASASTVDLGAQTSQSVRITGTVTITSFGTANSGVIRRIRFSGALTLTHNATSLILPGGASITTAAGDCAVVESLGSGNWLVRSYSKASGLAVVAGSSTDSNAIHGNTGGEIAAITDKATPVAADHLLIEDSASSDAKKDITISSLETALEGFLDLPDFQGTLTVAKGGTGATTASTALDALNGTAETTVASASTTDLGAVASQKVSITGTVTITSFGTVAAGTSRSGRFTGILTLTHNATSLILPGGANITTATGDSFDAVSLGSGNWAVYCYTKASGQPIRPHNLLSTTHGDVSAATVVRGDVLVGNSTPAWARVAMGSVGMSLTPWPNTDNTVDLVWKRAPNVWEFIGALGEWSTITFNSGTASATGAGDVSDSGVFTGTTGALTNGGAGIRTGTAPVVFGTTSEAVYWRVKTPAAVSSNTDGYELYIGVGDNNGTDAAPTDGAYFYYLHSVSSGIWIGRTRNNSSETTASGGASVTVTANSWWDLFLEGNSSSVKFWVSSDSGATWSYIGTSSATIPSTAGRESALNAYIRKVGPNPGGTTARILTMGRCMYFGR